MDVPEQDWFGGMENVEWMPELNNITSMIEKQTEVYRASTTVEENNEVGRRQPMTPFEDNGENRREMADMKIIYQLLPCSETFLRCNSTGEIPLKIA